MAATNVKKFSIDPLTSSQVRTLTDGLAPLADLSHLAPQRLTKAQQNGVALQIREHLLAAAGTAGILALSGGRAVGSFVFGFVMPTPQSFNDVLPALLTTPKPGAALECLVVPPNEKFPFIEAPYFCFRGVALVTAVSNPLAEAYHADMKFPESFSLPDLIFAHSLLLEDGPDWRTVPPHIQVFEQGGVTSLGWTRFHLNENLMAEQSLG